MKIIHCLNHFLPYQVAGTEVYAWALTKHLQRSGCTVAILIPNYGSTASDSYEYDGITVHRYAEPSLPDRQLITGQKAPDGLVNFTLFLQEEKPDIIHFHEIAGSNGIGVAHFEAAKQTGAAVVFTIHLAGNSCKTGTLMYEGKSLCDGRIRIGRCAYCTMVKRTGDPLRSKLLVKTSMVLYTVGINTLNWQSSLGTGLSYPFQIQQVRTNLGRIVTATDRIVPITYWYRDILRKNGVPENKMKVIPQALISSPGPRFPAPAGSSLPLKLIFIGRIDPLKGIRLLPEAIKQLDPDKITLDIFGSAPDAAFLEECRNLTAGQANIRWMGLLGQEQVVQTIARYDVLVLPSLFSEMSPLVIQEAFAAGTPVIGSNVYGIAEQVKHDVTGWLFEFGSAESLQHLLKGLIDKPGAIDKVRKNIPAVREFRDVAADYLQLYKELLGQPVPGTPI